MIINSFALMHLLAAAVLVSVFSVTNAFTKNDFPPHFLFGASTSAYQVSPSLFFSHINSLYRYSHSKDDFVLTFLFNLDDMKG